MGGRHELTALVATSCRHIAAHRCWRSIRWRWGCAESAINAERWPWPDGETWVRFLLVCHFNRSGWVIAQTPLASYLLCPPSFYMSVRPSSGSGLQESCLPLMCQESHPVRLDHARRSVRSEWGGDRHHAAVARKGELANGGDLLPFGIYWYHERAQLVASNREYWQCQSALLILRRVGARCRCDRRAATLCSSDPSLIFPVHLALCVVSKIPEPCSARPTEYRVWAVMHPVSDSREGGAIAHGNWSDAESVRGRWPCEHGGFWSHSRGHGLTLPFWVSLVWFTRLPCWRE